MVYLAFEIYFFDFVFCYKSLQIEKRQNIQLMFINNYRVFNLTILDKINKIRIKAVFSKTKVLAQLYFYII